MVFSSLFKIVTVLIHLHLFANLCESLLFIEGYYWRDFYGVGYIPTDAYPGGKDQNGNGIYIGQILHDNGIVMSKIYWNDAKAYYAFKGAENSGTNNIKILCTHNPDNFRWIQTDHDKIHLITKHDIVLGGYEPGHIIYIGRVFYKSETIVGKIISNKRFPFGLYITENGEEHLIKSFEILTYNSSYSKLINPTTTCKPRPIPV